MFQICQKLRRGRAIVVDDIDQLTELNIYQVITTSSVVCEIEIYGNSRIIGPSGWVPTGS
jgi:hypothetical protein